VAGSCESNNELSSSIKGGGFLHYLSDYQLLKDCAKWSKLVRGNRERYQNTIVNTMNNKPCI
jgi:hypothetical protein